MIRRLASLLERYWRVLGTGIAFAVFGVAALLLSLSLFPLLAVTARDAEAGSQRVQRAISQAFGLFMRLMRLLGLMSFEIRGASALPGRGRLIVANHPTLIDAVGLIALLPQADCIVKQDLTRNPFLRRAVRMAGYISNADPDALIAECAARLRAGRTLLVFPEGTRSLPGAPLRFHRGAARVALAAGCAVVPALVRCTPPTLRKHEPWYRVPPTPFHWSVEIFEPVAAARFAGAGTGDALAARRLTAFLENRLRAAPAVSAPQPPGQPVLQFPQGTSSSRS